MEPLVTDLHAIISGNRKSDLAEKLELDYMIGTDTRFLLEN